MPAKKSDTPKHATHDQVRVTKVRRTGGPEDVRPKRDPDPVLVRVRAGEENRGEYQWAIRNPGEVFDMDTAVMREWPLGKDSQNRQNQPIPPDRGETVVIETAQGTFELPPWVELVDPSEVEDEDYVPKGHPGRFDENNVEKNAHVL